MTDDDRKLTLPSKKLTEAETASLRSRLLPHLGGGGGEEDDATDLLEYAQAMLTNGKELGHVVDEMVGMELTKRTCQQSG